MGWRCALLLCVLGLAGVAPLSAEPPDSPHLIQDCAQRATSEARGIEALRTACPGIDKAVGSLGLDPLLPKDWPRRISPRALADWNDLATRYARPTPAGMPDPARLQSIARLLQPPPSSATWWERFKSWFKNWLRSDPGHWPNWLRSLPAWLPRAQILIFASIALVLIAAVALIVVELRAAGVFESGGRRSRQPRRGAQGLTAAAEPLTPADVDAAAPEVMPVILLRLLVEALTRSQRLDRDRVLTCRELITAARFDTAAQREIFARVALLAEQRLYGDPRHESQAPNDDVLGKARGLHGELLAPPAGGTH
jgi:hypothetical protein